MPTHTFTTPEPVLLLVDNGSGRVSVEAGDDGRTVVDVRGKHADDVRVTHDGDTVTVTPPRMRGFLGDGSLEITVTAPAGSRPEVKSGSADVTLGGRLGATAVRCGSGDVVVAEVSEPTLVETGSGDVRVEVAASDLRVKSGSGDVVVLRLDAGSVTASTGSGDLRVDDSAGEVGFKTGSGDLTVQRARRGRVQVKGASGDVRVGVPAGTPVWTDISTVSGRVRSELESLGAPAEGADHVEVAATTVSGDVHLRHV